MRATWVGDDPLRRRVERADVQRARDAQRGRGDARRERLVDVAEVERRALEEVAERARDVERQRRARRGPARRQRLADGDDERLALGALQQCLAALAREPARPRARARPTMTAPRRARGDRARELAGDLAHAVVDLVRELPGIRRHLGDREALGHGASIALKP